MTDRTDSEKAVHLDQSPNHIQVREKTGSGKSVLVIQKLLDAPSKTPSHLKINFRPNPSH